jgi:AcrR family transcriptional regulator
VTAPTVYYYFKNKEGLFNAVVRETVTMAEFTAKLEQECGRAPNATGRIKAFTETYLSSFPTKLINTGLYLRSSTALDAVGASTLMTEFARTQSILIEIIRSGIFSGEFRKTDPRMASECLLGMMHRFVFQRIHFKRSYDASEASSYLSSFFLQAMKPSS